MNAKFTLEKLRKKNSYRMFSTRFASFKTIVGNVSIGITENAFFSDLRSLQHVWNPNAPNSFTMYNWYINSLKFQDPISISAFQVVYYLQIRKILEFLLPFKVLTNIRENFNFF